MNKLFTFIVINKNMNYIRYNFAITVALVLIIVLKNAICGPVYSFTVNNILCMTDCQAWKGSRPYCYTNWHDWDYCIRGRDERPLYYASMKKQEEMECQSICSSYGEDYNWCWTDIINSEWDYCSKEIGKSSREGYSCVTPCVKRDYYSCYAVSIEKGDARTDYCSPKAGLFDAAIIKDIENRLIMACGRCAIKEIQDKQEKMGIHHYCEANEAMEVENIATTYESEIGFKTLDWNPGNQPVTSYVTLQAPPLKGHKDVKIPAVIKATITYNHIRSSKPKAYHNEERMKAMDFSNNDISANLLPASLGSNLDFNIAPLSKAVGSADTGTYWSIIKDVIKRFLEDHRGRVEWTLVLGYNLEYSRRSTYLGLHFRSYDAESNLLFDSNDCIFPNKPDKI